MSNLPKTRLIHEVLADEVNTLDLAKANAVHTHVEADITDLQAYLTEETDPVFTAWDKDYDDLTNKPTIPTVSDVAYDATTWDNNTDAPTKNAVRDKFESLTSGGLTQPQIMARTLGC